MPQLASRWPPTIAPPTTARLTMAACTQAGTHRPHAHGDLPALLRSIVCCGANLAVGLVNQYVPVSASTSASYGTSAESAPVCFHSRLILRRSEGASPANASADTTAISSGRLRPDKDECPRANGGSSSHSRLSLAWSRIAWSALSRRRSSSEEAGAGQPHDNAHVECINTGMRLHSPIAANEAHGTSFVSSHDSVLGVSSAGGPSTWVGGASPVAGGSSAVAAESSVLGVFVLGVSRCISAYLGVSVLGSSTAVGELRPAGSGEFCGGWPCCGGG